MNRIILQYHGSVTSNHSAISAAMPASYMQVRPEYFSVSDSPKVHEMPFQVAAIQNICMNGTQIMDPEMMTGEIEELEFFIIQALSGDIVSAYSSVCSTGSTK